MTADERTRLLELFRTRAVTHGQFTLASGRTSRYYINSKQVLFHGETMTLLGAAFDAATADLDIQAVGGLEVGALPLATALVMAAHQRGRELEGFFVRKEAKPHGSQALIEGRLRPGDRVAILDDVLTTGGSAVQAIAEVERVGAKVVCVVCIVDRLAGAAERLRDYNFRPLFTSADLGLPPE